MYLSGDSLYLDVITLSPFFLLGEVQSLAPALHQFVLGFWCSHKWRTGFVLFFLLFICILLAGFGWSGIWVNLDTGAWKRWSYMEKVRYP